MYSRLSEKLTTNLNVNSRPVQVLDNTSDKFNSWNHIRPKTRGTTTKGGPVQHKIVKLQKSSEAKVQNLMARKSRNELEAIQRQTLNNYKEKDDNSYI